MVRVYPQNRLPGANPTEKQKRPGWRLRLLSRGCLSQLLFALCLISLIIGSLIASTGIVHLPILSELFYRPAEPSRLVETIDADRQPVGQRLSQKMSLSLERRESGLTITELELTQLLKLALVNQETGIGDVQAVIEASGIEVFGHLSGRRPYAFTLLLQPVIRNGQIDFSVEEAALERLPLPANLVNYLVHNFIRSGLSRFHNQTADYVVPKDIQLSSRTLMLIGQIKKSSLPF